MKTSHIQRAIKLMWEKYKDPDFRVNDIALGVSFSPWYFNRSFTKAVGYPPGRYLSAIRRYRAVQLIQGSRKLSFDQVTYQVGFSSIGSFGTTIKKEIGVTPQDLRTLLIEGKISPIPDHDQNQLTPPIYILTNNQWSGPLESISR